MSASLELLGIKQLLNTLERLPDAVQAEAQTVVRASAMTLHRDLERAVPIGPGGTRDGKRYPGGGLRRSVKMKHLDELRSMVWYGTNPGGGAPHGHLYEDGTTVRKNYTRKNANRGTMPKSGKPYKLLARLASAQRRVMNEALTPALDRALRALGLRAAA
jgi:hypothetical protein